MLNIRSLYINPGNPPKFAIAALAGNEFIPHKQLQLHVWPAPSWPWPAITVATACPAALPVWLAMPPASTVTVVGAAAALGSAVGVDGQLFEIGHCFVAGGFGVDAEDHAFAAVDAVLLFAVEPCHQQINTYPHPHPYIRLREVGGHVWGRTKRIGRSDSHVPSYASFTLGVRHEAAVHSSFHLLARLGESRLCGGVVLLHEFEYHHVADSRGDGLGGVAEERGHSGCDGLHSADDDLDRC
jgi:hypothetical protein